MQIKILKFLSIITIAFITTNVHADLLYKFSLSEDAQKVKAKDIKENPDFGKSGFVTGICDGKTVSGSQTHCVKLFSDVQVQNISQAIQIAKDYAKEKNNDDIVCYEKYYGCGLLGCDDHIYCSTVPSKKTYYEFVFDDIVEHFSTDYKEGIAKAYCKMVFGEDIVVKNDGQAKDNINYVTCWENYDTWYTNNKPGHVVVGPKSKCAAYETQTNTLKKLLSNNYGFEVLDNCNNWKINFITKQCNSLDTYQGIKNERFKKQQMALGANIVPWLYGYVSNNLSEKINTFKCDLSAKSCLTDDIFNPLDDYLTCYVNGNPIDFRFDDLSEIRQNRQKAASDVMKCMSQGGEWDSEACHGFSQEQCEVGPESLKAQTNGGAHWDPNFGCILDNAAFITRLEKGEEITIKLTGTAVVLAASVATLAETGGTSAIAFWGFASAVIGGMLAADTISKEEEIDAQVTAFINQTEKCINNNDTDCIHKNIKTFLNGFSTYMDIVHEDKAATAEAYLAKGVKQLLENPEEQDKMIESINAEKNKTYFEKYFSENSPELAKAYAIESMAAMLCDFVPIEISVLTKFGQISKFAKTSSVLNTFLKTPKAAESLKGLKTASNIAHRTQKIKNISYITADITPADVLNIFR